MEVNRETGGRRKGVEDVLKLEGRADIAPAKDESVVGVLQNRARQVGREGVEHEAILPRETDKALKDIRNDDEEIGGKGVALPKPVAAPNPVPGHAIEKDGSVPRGEDALHPSAPTIVKAPGPEDGNQAMPVDRVKGLTEVDLKNNGRSSPGVAAAEEVSGIDNVLGDAPSGKKTSLVRVHKVVDGRLQPGGQSFRDGFHDAVLEGNGAELGWMRCRVTFREEDKKGPVNSGQVNSAVEKGGEHL
jgi:hypothetical protein